MYIFGALKSAIFKKRKFIHICKATFLKLKPVFDLRLLFI